MAAIVQSSLTLQSTAPSALSFQKCEVSGGAVQGLPMLTPSKTTYRILKVVAGGAKKLNTKEPFGPSKELKFRNGVDASGRKGKGKGVYQFGKKYGANVDGYSPIYTRDEWASSGDVYAGGQTGLLLWGVTLAAILLAGVLLVYNTSALTN